MNRLDPYSNSKNIMAEAQQQAASPSQSSYNSLSLRKEALGDNETRSYSNKDYYYNGYDGKL